MTTAISRTTTGYTLRARLTPHTAHSPSCAPLAIEDALENPTDSFLHTAPASHATSPHTAHVLLLTRATSGAAPRPYYDAAQDARDRDACYADLPRRAGQMRGGALFEALHRLVAATHTTQLDYKPNRDLYPRVDRHPDGTLKSIYAGDVREPAYPLTRAARNAALQTAAAVANTVAGGVDSRVRQLVVNAAMPLDCEHVVPQSWFGYRMPMRGDLHHLFACDASVNSSRGNRPYGEKPHRAGQQTGASFVRQRQFEPEGGKGAVARATLYFLVRYPGIVKNTPAEYTQADINMLVRWSRENPPTDYERHRNAEIARKQGNRNPFIDFPEWATMVDFSRGLGHRGRSEHNPLDSHRDAFATR